MNASIIRNEKGIVLMIALMVLIMMSLMGLAAVLTGTTDVQIAANSAHSTQALYLAEAGVGQVKSWFENPASFNPPGGSYTLDANNSMGIYTFPQQFFKNVAQILLARQTIITAETSASSRTSITAVRLPQWTPIM
jgi:Tfp pilus assembly protein PilX